MHLVSPSASFITALYVSSISGFHLRNAADLKETGRSQQEKKCLVFCAEWKFVQATRITHTSWRMRFYWTMAPL